MVFSALTFRDLYEQELREVNHCHGTGTKGHPCGAAGQWRRTLRQRSAGARAHRIHKSLDRQMRSVNGDVNRVLKIRKRMDRVAFLDSRQHANSLMGQLLGHPAAWKDLQRGLGRNVR